MLSFLVFVLVLSILVLFHELGHFLAAKKNGILVEEFGLGMPPKVLGKKFGETIYSVNLFPFGGFVRLRGEDPTESTEADLLDKRIFISKTPAQRLIVVFSGVIMNLILGAFLFYLFLGFNGFKSSQIPLIFPHEFKFGKVYKTNTVIYSLDDNSPLSKLDKPVELGDSIEKIDGIKVNSIYDVRKIVESKGGQSVMVTVKSSKEGEIRDVEITPYMDTSGTKPLARLGVYLGSVAEIHYETLSQKIFSGFTHSYNILSFTVSMLKNIIEISLESRSAEPLAESVSGPVGIYSVISGVLSSPGKALLNLMDLMAQISLSLAFMNILPLPALDGGRAFFIFGELITGKKMNAILEAKIHQVGMLVLLSILVLVTVQDISKLL